MKWLSSISGLDEYFVMKVVPNLLLILCTSSYLTKIDHNSTLLMYNVHMYIVCMHVHMYMYVCMYACMHMYMYECFVLESVW